MERQAKDGTIYRKVGSDEWEPVTRLAKDGTTYRKVGKDEWAPAQDNAPAEQSENAQKKFMGIPHSTIEGALQAAPFAGALFGGAGGFVSPMPGGALVGAGLGAAGGEALANTVRSALDMETAPKTSREVIERPLKEGLVGATGEGAGQIAAKGLPMAIKAAPRMAKKISAYLRGVEVPDEILNGKTIADVGLEPVTKANAGDIAAATERVGGQATPGMVTSNKNLQNVENVLSQSPTIAGEKVRRSYEPIQKGLQESAEKVAGTPNLSPYEAGEQFKAGISKKVMQKSEPLSAKFEMIRESSKHIRPSSESLGRAANRLMKQDLAEFSDLPQGQAIKKYAGMLREAKSIDSLKQLRSSVSDEMSRAIDAGDGQLAMALGKVKGAIQRLERREILKAAIEASPNKAAGDKAAKELITEIKSVNKGWSALMGELEEIASAGGIKRIESPKHLVRIIDDMPSEKISERFFNTKNYQGLKDVKKHLPDEFEILRQAKLSQLAEKSMTRGEPDPVKLIRNVKAIGPEARELLFGESGERIIADMETVLNAMPAKVGTSDTPRGIAWFTSVLKPSRWSEEAHSAYNYMLLKGKVSKGPKPRIDQKMLPQAAGYIGVSKLSKKEDAPAKGPKRWESVGIERIIEHDAGIDRSSIEKIAKSARGRKLLYEASDLKPGSKAMDNVLMQIKALSKEQE